MEAAWRGGGLGAGHLHDSLGCSLLTNPVMASSVPVSISIYVRLITNPRARFQNNTGHFHQLALLKQH